MSTIPASTQHTLIVLVSFPAFLFPTRGLKNAYVGVFSDIHLFVISMESMAAVSLMLNIILYIIAEMCSRVFYPGTDLYFEIHLDTRLYTITDTHADIVWGISSAFSLAIYAHFIWHWFHTSSDNIFWLYQIFRHCPWHVHFTRFDIYPDNQINSDPSPLPSPPVRGYVWKEDDHFGGSTAVRWTGWITVFVVQKAHVKLWKVRACEGPLLYFLGKILLHWSTLILPHVQHLLFVFGPPHVLLHVVSLLPSSTIIGTISCIIPGLPLSL